MHARIILTAVSLALAAASWSLAQGTKADYERAANLRRQVSGKVLKDRIDAQWLPGGDKFWYRNRLAEGEVEFVFVNAASGERRRAFDHDEFAAALSEKLGRRFDPRKLPVEKIDVDEAEKIHISAAGRAFVFDGETGELSDRDEKLPQPSPSRKPDRVAAQAHARRDGKSPDGAWHVRVEEGNVVARAGEGDARIQLTKDEKLDRVGVYWSPDSTRFALLQTQREQEHTVHMIESSPRDQVQPRLKSHQYLKPGDRIAITQVRLFDIGGQREIPIDKALFSDPWEINRLRWADDSSRFTLVYNERGHGLLRLVAVDAGDGTARSLVEDHAETFVDYAHKQFICFLEDRGDIIWMSERDGWNHLYRFDAYSGELKKQITSGEWVVRGVDRVDAENEQIWFRAGGIDKDQDPYHVHYCRVNFDGSGLLRLTAGDGTHEIRFSPDRRYFIDRYSRVDLPPSHELRRTDDGALMCKLEEADISGLQSIAGWRMPERFVAKGRDGQTDIWGIIHRPTNFDGNKKYPIVEKIYAGPHGQHVPKRFDEYFTAQQIAELGFIVVQIDGMGTNWRSKKFHDVCWKNLKDAGFPDRIAWMQAAAKKYPYMDTQRVGIYGGSAGGQNALGGLLFHPEFYKVAVADCGCHDNRMDKIWWNEAWMGKIGPHYAENSNVTHAHKLQGKLFLTVGELDTNVDPASTMQVVGALIKADKDFDLVVVPGGGHGVGEGPYLARRRQDFFVQHLLGVEPRR